MIRSPVQEIDDINEIVYEYLKLGILNFIEQRKESNWSAFGEVQNLRRHDNRHLSVCTEIKATIRKYKISGRNFRRSTISKDDQMTISTYLSTETDDPHCKNYVTSLLEIFARLGEIELSIQTIESGKLSMTEVRLDLIWVLMRRALVMGKWVESQKLYNAVEKLYCGLIDGDTGFGLLRVKHEFIPRWLIIELIDFGIISELLVEIEEKTGSIRLYLPIDYD